MAEGQAAGLAILSQDGTTVTDMIGFAETDMMSADGTVSGDTLIPRTRPHTGRTAAFAKCEVTITGDRMNERDAHSMSLAHLCLSDYSGEGCATAGKGGGIGVETDSCPGHD